MIFNSKPKQSLEIVDNFVWKDLDEESSKKFGIRPPGPPDEIIFCEKSNKWAGKLKYHILPGLLFSAENFEINGSVKSEMNRVQFEKMFIQLFKKIIEIMEKNNINRFEARSTTPSMTRFLLSLGADLMAGSSSNLVWELDKMKDVRFKKIRTLD